MGAEEGARKRVRGSGGAGACEGDYACVPSAGEELEALQRLLAEERARSASLSAELDALRSSAAGAQLLPGGDELHPGGATAGRVSAVHMHAGLADLAMDALNEGISIADCTQPEAPLIYVNSGFCRMTGFSKEETVGHNCRFLQGIDTDPAVVAQLRAGIAAGQPVSVQLLNYRKDGTPFQNALSLTPIRAPDGRVTHFVGIQSDVTQLCAHRDAELAALKTAAEAEAATAAKSRFLAHMSHEIRTPLNGILAVGQMLEESTLSEEQHDLVATIRTSGETLLSLICDILDFSRIEAQKLLLEERPFYLEEALERTLQICCMSAAKKRINVTVRVDEGLPSCLIGDAGRLQQVLLNALGNSLKFTPNGGVVQLHCGVATGERGQRMLHIAVADSGIGISPAGLAKLFASFSQVDSSPSRKYDGAGLGLAISRRLCEAMGGTMRAESPGLGHGSTFHITLALKEAPAAVTDGGGAALPYAPAPTLAGRRLLVVDACAPVRAAIAHWLRSWGASHVEEADGAAGLAAALARAPDWDAVITESTSPCLQAVLSHLDGAGPACAQNTCEDSGEAPGVASGERAAAEPVVPAPQLSPRSAGPTLRVFALAWPVMPPPMDPKLPGAPRPSHVAPLMPPTDAALTEEAPVCPQDLVACSITISKPVRQSRLRDALVAAFGPEPPALGEEAVADAGADGATGGGMQPSGRPLHASNSMASFASCGDAEGSAPGAMLPLVPPAARGGGAAPAATAAMSDGAPKLRVMLAEDHVINQKVVISLLKRYGHAVACVANDGLDALEKLRATPGGPTAFDVILMDLHMPRMGGMDATAAIAKEWPNHGTPVIAVTADAFEESRQRCLDAGFAGWLSKPFRVDGMMAVLTGVLQAKAAGAGVAAAACVPVA